MARLASVEYSRSVTDFACQADGMGVRRKRALGVTMCLLGSAFLTASCRTGAQNVPGLPPGATSGAQLFSRHGPSGSTVTGYKGGSPACPSVQVINVVVQYGRKTQGFSAILSGTAARSPVVEISLYATTADFPKVVISHVAPSVSRLKWAAGSRTYDQMKPAGNWAVEIGPYLPVDAWRVDNPNTADGELVAYSGPQQVTTLAVSGLDALPPTLPSQLTCSQ